MPRGRPLKRRSVPLIRLVVPSPDATDVPRNVKPVVALAGGETAPRLLVGEDEVAIDVATFSIVDGFGATPWSQLLPAASLPENTLVLVEVNGAVVGSFTTGTSEDDTAPEAPVLGAAEPYSGGSCTPFVQIPVTGSADTVLFVATTAADAPTQLSGATLSGVGLSSPVVVSGEDGATSEVQLAAVDAAGNLSGASAIDVTFPFSEGRGPPACNHAAASSPRLGVSGMCALLMCAWLVTSPRRRKHSGRKRE